MMRGGLAPVLRAFLFPTQSEFRSETVLAGERDEALARAFDTRAVKPKREIRDSRRSYRP